MSNEENKELLEELEALKKENADLKNNNDELKNIKGLADLQDKYTKIIEKKDEEIAGLEQANQQIQDDFKEKEQELADSVGKELQTSEQYKELLATVEELKTQQAISLVESYINKGVILPAQKETAVKLAIKDSETFNELYKDQPPIINTQKERKSIKTEDTLEKLSKYFKGE